MKEKRRLELFIETSEITKISFKRNRTAAFFCRRCGTETVHLTISEAASLSKITETAVIRSIDAGQFHSIETAAGWLLVCGPSLSVPA